MSDPRQGDLRWLRDTVTFEGRTGIYPRFTLQVYEGSWWHDVPEVNEGERVLLEKMETK